MDIVIIVVTIVIPALAVISHLIISNPFIFKVKNKQRGDRSRHVFYWYYSEWFYYIKKNHFDAVLFATFVSTVITVIFIGILKVLQSPGIFLEIVVANLVVSHIGGFTLSQYAAVLNSKECIYAEGGNLAGFFTALISGIIGGPILAHHLHFHGWEALLRYSYQYAGVVGISLTLHFLLGKLSSRAAINSAC